RLTRRKRTVAMVICNANWKNSSPVRIRAPKGRRFRQRSCELPWPAEAQANRGLSWFAGCEFEVQQSAPRTDTAKRLHLNADFKCLPRLIGVDGLYRRVSPG